MTLPSRFRRRMSWRSGGDELEDGTGLRAVMVASCDHRLTVAIIETANVKMRPRLITFV